jgi:hypothetical protein
MAGYNIRDILQAAGYELIKANILINDTWHHVLEIRFTPEEIRRKLAEIEQGSVFGFGLYGTFTVIISDVGFNGEGGLYVVLETPDGECFDVIEFGGDI